MLLLFFFIFCKLFFFFNILKKNMFFFNVYSKDYYFFFFNYKKLYFFINARFKKINWVFKKLFNKRFQIMNGYIFFFNYFWLANLKKIMFFLSSMIKEKKKFFFFFSYNYFSYFKSLNYIYFKHNKRVYLSLRNKKLIFIKTWLNFFFFKKVNTYINKLISKSKLSVGISYPLSNLLNYSVNLPMIYSFDFSVMFFSKVITSFFTFFYKK